MSEIPMPGGYEPSEPRRSSEKGFCSVCCENTCRAVGICFVVIVVIFLIFFMSYF